MNCRAANCNRWFVMVLLVALVGCGEKSARVPLTGTVTLKGQPLPNGTLQFFSLHAQPVIASTDETGKYQVDLAPSDYQVTINLVAKLPPGWKEGDLVPRQAIVVPAEYTTRARTPLKATVSASQTEPIDFVLP